MQTTTLRCIDMDAVVGLRVVRGRDWDDDNNIDGGEGFVGTVVEICGDSSTKSVLVQWDSGERQYHRAGYQGAYDLCVLDSSPTGKRIS